MVRDFAEQGGMFDSKETGLAPHYINAWMALAVQIWNLTDREIEIHGLVESTWERIPYYEDYLRQQLPVHQRLEEVITTSDSLAVARVNALVDRFNSLRSRLREKKDYKGATYFYRRAEMIILPLKKRKNKT